MANLFKFPERLRCTSTHSFSLTLFIDQCVGVCFHVCVFVLYVCVWIALVYSFVWVFDRWSFFVFFFDYLSFFSPFLFASDFAMSVISISPFTSRLTGDEQSMGIEVKMNSTQQWFTITLYFSSCMSYTQTHKHALHLDLSILPSLQYFKKKMLHLFTVEYFLLLMPFMRIMDETRLKLREWKMQKQITCYRKIRSP